MTTFQSHPFADVFPLLNEKDHTALVEDICANGLREPITLCGGMVLDGRNRLRACQDAGIEPRFHDYDGLDPAAFVVSLILRRHHLDESQRAMVAAKLATLGEGRPLKNSANLQSFLGEDSAPVVAIPSAKAADLLFLFELFRAPALFNTMAHPS